MLLTDVTKILKVLLASFQLVASPDELTQRRIGQIGEVIGAVDDVAAAEGASATTVTAKREAEAHDIIHRVAAILAMEECAGDEPLAEVPWDGNLEGETIELSEEAEE